MLLQFCWFAYEINSEFSNPWRWYIYISVYLGCLEFLLICFVVFTRMGCISFVRLPSRFCVCVYVWCCFVFQISFFCLWHLEILTFVQLLCYQLLAEFAFCYTSLSLDSFELLKNVQNMDSECFISYLLVFKTIHLSWFAALS